MLINYNSLKSDRGAGLTEALKILKCLFGDSLLGACDSILLGVTHVPLHDAEGDEETTLNDVVGLFQDTPNVADEMAQVLGRLVQRLFIYHPLNRGHSSWLKREELIQTINALPPIRDPLKTFHTVLSLTDCEFLRNTVKALKDRSLDAMKEDRFMDVLFCLQYMDSIEVVQHDLASNIINEAKAEGSRCLLFLSDKIWEHSSHCRFDEAKAFLDRLKQAAKDLQPHPLGGEAERLHSMAAERLEASRREKERTDLENQERATALSTLHSGTHGRARREERGIQKIDLQRARRYGMKEAAHNGRHKYTYGGIVFIYDPLRNREVTSFPAKDISLDTSGTRAAQPVLLDKKPQYELPAEVQQHRDKCAEMMANFGAWTSHSVLVIDMSGSMRRDDVNGARCRSDGVWMVLARDYVKRELEKKTRSCTDLISVVLMRDEAEVVVRAEPTDWVLYNTLVDLREWDKVRPSGPGNTILKSHCPSIITL
jgi:hypothetical protein